MAVPEENRRQPKKPSIAIFVHAGETEPTVFSTAMSNQEQSRPRRTRTTRPIASKRLLPHQKPKRNIRHNIRCNAGG